MKNPFVTIIRRMALQQGRSTVPTKLMPLAKVHSAVVYVNAMAQDEEAGRICHSVQQFFDYQGIPVQILCATKETVNWRGFLRNLSRNELVQTEELQFLTL